MGNLKNILIRYKFVFIIFAFLIISFFVYAFVHASDDIYENQIEVVNQRLNIIDGTPNINGSFDANDEAGNDSANNNKIVRTFDTVTYELTYDLAYKADSTLSDEDKILENRRDVIADILVPSNLSLNVSDDGMNVLNEELTIDNSGNPYKYYKLEIKNVSMSESNSVDIIFSNISGKNNDEIKPIIRLREETQDVVQITTTTNIQDINGLDIPTVRISARENYGINLYQGTIKKDDENVNSRLPIGILVYLPYDQNREFKGIEVPEQLQFDLNINCNTESDKSTIIESNISNYAQNSEYIVSGLPYSYSNNNGDATVEENYLNQDKNSSLKIKFSNLKFDTAKQMITLSENRNVYYISTKLFVFTNKRESNYKSDITYNISTTAPNSNTLTDYLDNYNNIIGDYVSTIDFFNRSTSTDGIVPIVESGKAIYNYNEEFYIQNTINYGINKGDKLQNGLINYIKFDTDAFTLEDVGNESDASKDYYIQFGSDSTQVLNHDIKYIIGEWNSSYFELADNKPSYCPTSLTNVTKEQFMNMYGGPCIKEKNTITSVSSLAEAQSQSKLNKIIALKLTITDDYPTGLETIVRLKAKVNKKTANIGKTFQRLTRGTNKAGNYYLSEIPKISISNQSSDMVYNKTTYDNDYNLTNLHNTTIGNNTLTANVGNTILVSSFKTMINEIGLKDAYDSEKTTFYSGMTDPIKFTINPVIYKSDYDATITSATISVYLPEQLEIYEVLSDKKYNRSTSGNTETIDGVNYVVYNYDYSESDINFANESVSGTIPNLVVHAYISLATEDRTNINVLARITGTLKTNNDATQTFISTLPVDQRTATANLTLRNIRDINTIGKTDILNMDKNGTFNYNMRIANASSDPVDVSLLYILPYSGDSIGDGSKFSGTLSISIAQDLPEGYTAYYTTDNAKTILSNELSSSANVNWNAWTDYRTPKGSITAIKIVPSGILNPAMYFGPSKGITLKIDTKNNKESDKYYNNFYIVQKDADVCVSQDILDDCTTTEKKTVSYSSNISEVSVYNRSISGYVFEDSNYNGFYDKTEPRLKSIAVDLYKLSKTEFDANNPVEAISSSDKLVQEDTTNEKGAYKFEGLPAGNYYVKYTFDCDKYTTTEKNKTDPSAEGDTSIKDSDAQMVPQEKDSKVCYAVSNIQTLNNDTLSRNYIDLGLRVRQDFDVSIKKYITNVTVNSNKGTQSYDYNNQTKVKVDVKNLKNTSFKVTYGIEIENTKYFPGTIGSIIETIPKGMTFDPNKNDGWYESEGYLYYSYLSKSLIMPGEKYYLTITLDLVTDSGGDYINLVAANNLQIKPVVTNFFEVPEAENQGGDE